MTDWKRYGRKEPRKGARCLRFYTNIILDDVDKELERRGHRFCRYADDCNIYVRSKSAGERVMASVSRFLEGRLKLRVNREKSAVARPWERKFLGYSMTSHRNPKLKVSWENLQRFRKKIRVEVESQGKEPRGLDQGNVYPDHSWMGELFSLGRGKASL